MHATIFLDDYAQSQPEATAMCCAQRVTTYRKLRSRIERATARLQGEWGIAHGDTVAYCGTGHQDGVVLYFALLHCGANLLILPGGDAGTASALTYHNAVLVLNDDGEQIAGLPDDVRVFPLHAIIATPCSHQVDTPWAQEAIHLLHARPDDCAAITSQSSATLFMRLQPTRETMRVDAGRLFDAAVFAPKVLSVLAGGGVLHIL